MEMVQSEFKIFLIPESVSLPFDGFDFVVGPFDNGAGDRMPEVIEQPAPIPSQGLGDLGQVFDSGPERVCTPSLQECSCRGEIVLFPEEPELFLHGMNGEERLVGLKQSIEPGLPVRFEVLVVAQQEESVSFEGLLSQSIQFLLLFSTQLFDGVIDESHDVVAVEDNIDVRQNLAHRTVVGTAHVHGHRFKPPALSGELFQERGDVCLAFAFYRMKDSSALQIGNDRHVLMAFPDAELVNADVADFVEGNGPIEKAQFGFMDVFDQVPAHAKVVCDPADGPEAEKIQNREGKGTDISMFPHHEWQAWPPQSGTIGTSQAMKVKDQNTFLAPDGAHEKPSGLLALHGGFAATAFGTLDQSVGHLGSQNHRIGIVVSRFIADTLQSKSMVQYGCGHGLLSPPVRLASNKWGSCHVHSLFSTLRYSSAG
jgi:hypothetical protein